MVAAHLLQPTPNLNATCSHSAIRGPSLPGPQPLQSGLHSLPTGDLDQDRLVAFCPERVDDLTGVGILSLGVRAAEIQHGLLGGRREYVPEIGHDLNGIQICDGARHEADLPGPIHEPQRPAWVGTATKATPVARGNARCTLAAVSPVSTGTRSPYIAVAMPAAAASIVGRHCSGSCSGGTAQ